MSDVDEELVALAGGAKGPVDSKKRSGRPKAADLGSDSDVDMDVSSGEEAAAAAGGGPEDEDDDSDAEEATANKPFPYQGLYVDAEDKRRIDKMSELEREAILGERQETLQAIKDRENLKSMVRRRDGDDDDDDDDGSGGRQRSSKRDKARTGVTREKENKMEELKRKRQEKGKKAKAGDGEDGRRSKKKRRKRGGDDDDWGASSDDEAAEQRQLSKEQKQARRRDAAAQADQLRTITLTRKRATELCSASFFADYATGMWARVIVQGGVEAKYRVGKITEVIQKPKYYEIREQVGPNTFESTVTNLALVVAIGKQSRPVPFTDLSNSPLTDREYAYLIGELEAQGVALPSRPESAKKLETVNQYRSWVKDEAAIMAQVRAKKAFRAQVDGAGRLTLTDKLRLKSELALALQADDLESAGRIRAQLDAARMGGDEVSEAARRMAEVNERNRKANREEIRKAEIKATEERRAQLRALEKGEAIKVDPSARLKMNVNRTHDRGSTDSSRAITPGTVTPQAGGADGHQPPSISAAVKAAEARGPSTRFDEMVATSAEALDLGDF